MSDRSTLHGRLASIGVAPARLATLGIHAPELKPNTLNADGINPAAVQKQADRAHARELADRAVSDIASWRAYRDAPNPFARARMREANGGSIERGRELDTEPEPPSAA